ncbi:hypothetical protein ACJVC5_05815 [Peredibacter sp. HCB2-198]|uniref:hypothetical protein n=1 Tax=Peredibacter sp. HCB2-198 TaxID=3383025 RepID=UPI0038B50011
MKLILLLGLVSFSLCANAKQPIRDEVLKLLPSELSQLSSKSSREEIEKIFQDKIKSKEQDALYLHYFSAKNDVTIGLKKNRFHYLYAQLPNESQTSSQSLFRRVYSGLSSKEKEKLEKSLQAPSHDAGRTITIEVPGENLKLEFANNESKRLRSVTIWPMNGKRP